LHKQKSRRAPPWKEKARRQPLEVIEMDCISRRQLIEELEARAQELEFVVAFAQRTPRVATHFAPDAEELATVRAFLASLQQEADAAIVPQSATHNATNHRRAGVKRCPHFKAIRRCYAIAADRGLNTKDEPAMRCAFGRALGREVTMREELNGDDWEAVGDLMQRGTLAW